MATMLQSRPPSDESNRDGLAHDMDSSQPSIPQYAQSLPQSAASSEMPSPVQSFFSKARSARSGSTASSIPSSPVMRDSLELFNTPKRFLTDVKEEPQEREDADMLGAVRNPSVHHYAADALQTPGGPSTFRFISKAHNDFKERELLDSQLPVTPSFKKRRSSDSTAPPVIDRMGARLNSLSKKWKTKTGASPKLSIVTDSETACFRTSPVPSQLASPASSVVSKHESLPSTVAGSDASLSTPLPPPEITDSVIAKAEEDQGQATTPLLPPAVAELSSQDPTVHSPLQSPTIAETPSLANSSTPDGTPQLPSCYPSPPLSTKPSLTSIQQRSRAGTLVPSSEIPPISMFGHDEGDMWNSRLGHADFNIYPEPYLPKVLDASAFKLFRENWDLARHNYAKHLTRTGEHYGRTSKTFLLTEEKWAFVDAEWKQNDDALTAAVGPLVASSSGMCSESSDFSCSTNVLDQPSSKVVVPNISHPSGKFPDMGDEDIVGPMTVGPSRTKPMQQIPEPVIGARIMKKRNFLKFISDFFGRGVGSSLRA